MAISTIHKLDKVVMPSSVEFSQINSARWQAGIQSLLEHPAGHTYPMFRANQVQQPVLEFSTPQLSTLLAAIGVGGAAVGSTATYFKLATSTGSVARATTSHRKVTIASSVAHWTQIRLPHNGRGEATVMMTAVYDGVNDPFVYAGSQALSGNLTATEIFGAGPVAINGSSVPGVQEITIESGVRLLQLGGESEVWDTFVGIELAQPVVTIKTLENVNWATLGLAGTILNGTTGLTFYARKFLANGARALNASTVHVKFVGALGTAIPVDSNGEATQAISDTIRCELVAASDSVVPLVITTGSAIS